MCVLFLSLIFVTIEWVALRVEVVFFVIGFFVGVF